VYTTDPHSCQSRQVHLQVVTDPGDQQGRTVIDDNQPANVNACMIPIVDNIKTRVKSVFKDSENEAISKIWSRRTGVPPVIIK